jgi:hypothetical protein
MAIGKNLAKHKQLRVEFSVFFIIKYNDSYILICYKMSLKNLQTKYCEYIHTCNVLIETFFFFLDMCQKTIWYLWVVLVWKLAILRCVKIHIFKTLGVLSKYIAIGRQLLEIYHVFIIVLFALTNFSSFFGAKWPIPSSTIGCWIELVIVFKKKWIFRTL